MYITTDFAEQMIVVQDYSERHDVIARAKQAGGPVQEDHPGIPLYLRPYTVDPEGLFTRAAPVMQNTGSTEKHRASDGSVTVKFKKEKPSSETA